MCALFLGSLFRAGAFPRPDGIEPG